MNVKMEFIKKYLPKIKEGLDEIDLDELQKIIDVLFEAYTKERKIFVCGNGGSASSANHFVCDLGKGTIKNYFNLDEKRFKVISLCDNLPLITAYGNDLGYENIFSQQIINLAKKGDIVMFISASGNSPNILKAINVAKEKNLLTIGLYGFGGGKAANLTERKIILKNDHYNQVEDIHMIILHLIAYSLKEKV